MSNQEQPQVLAAIVVFAVFTALAAWITAMCVQGLGAGYYFWEIWGLIVAARLVAITTGLTGFGN